MPFLRRSRAATPAPETRADDAATVASTVFSDALLAAMVYGPDYYLELIPHLFRARSMTVDAVAQLPAAAWRGTDRLDDGPVPFVTVPNVHQTRRDFLADTVSSLIDHGNAFWLINVAGDDLQVAQHADVAVSWDTARRRRLYAWRDRPLAPRLVGEAIETILPTGGDPAQARIVHLALGMGPGDLTGSSPLKSNRLAGIAAHLAYTLGYFQTAAVPSGVLEHPGTLGRGDAERLRKQWDDAHTKGRFTAVLSGGMSYRPLPLSPEQSEWDSVLQAGILDCANLLGVPPYMLGYAGPSGPNQVYSNVGSIGDLWMRTTLQPTYLSRIEAAWTLLVPRGQRVQLDPDEVTRGSRETRYASHQTGLAAGFLTVDEVRRMEGLGPIEHPGRPADRPVPETEN